MDKDDESMVWSFLVKQTLFVSFYLVINVIKYEKLLCHDNGCCLYETTILWLVDV